ncbi:MAG: UvrD-helicase domain-containing protein [Planctomycetes bacterium]|nr:UvrD-helicase domain-containing protein [Planctomycetota bacterium]
MREIFAETNPRQEEAIRRTEGPLLIAAGAGTGKTRVITRRIAHLALRGCEPWRILAVTFTNKAAEEMARRVERLTGRQGVHISTFHSFGAHLLRREAESLGLSRSFTIYDEKDRLAAVQEVLRSLDRDPDKSDAREIAHAISSAKNELVGPEEYARAARRGPEDLAALVYQRYETLLAACSALDFDDLLVRTLRALREDSALRERWQERFRYILVDEFQDTNRCQYEIVRILAEKHRNLCVTGDPDQSIYSWRGASPENLAAFEKDFPEAAFVALEENYRSTGTILRAASELVKNNALRKDVTLWTRGPAGDPVRAPVWATDRAEARGIAAEVARRLAAGGSGDDVAVFYRVNAQSRSFEEAFLAEGIPYVVVGSTEFYERREVKDLLAYLRLAVNPADEIAFRRIVNVPRRKVGPKAMEILAAFAAEQGLSLAHALPTIPPHILSRTAREGLADLAEVLSLAAETAGGPAAGALAAIAERTRYLDCLGDRADPEILERHENVAELLQAAREHDEATSAPTVASFLEKVALVSSSEVESGDSGGAVRLMTLHAAKGLEFDVVFITGLEDGLIPHSGRAASPADLEEERRLLYVGMTRARRELHLSRALRRNRFGRTQEAFPSRFLFEIPEEVLDSAAAPLEPSRYVWDPDPGVLDEDEIPLRGERVRHPAYGEGVVLSVTSRGRKTRLKVQFDGEGTKVLFHEHAQLTRIPE